MKVTWTGSIGQEGKGIGVEHRFSLLKPWLSTVSPRNRHGPSSSELTRNQRAVACCLLYWVSAPFQTVGLHHCSPEIACLIVSIPVLGACS